MEKEKLYRAEWFKYTSSGVNQFVRKNGAPIDENNSDTIEVGNILIRESEIPYYQQYGNGLKKLEFVSYIYNPTIKKVKS